MTSGIRRRLFTALLLGLTVIAPVGHAQRKSAPEAAIYVHDSGVAVEKLALAEKLERLKEWDRAADQYLEVVRDFADRVVPAGDDDKRFVNIVPTVNARLAKWPAEGVAAFRTRFEPAASTALDAAGHDPNQLQTLIGQYYLTDAAKRAAFILIDDRLEAGAFDTARTLAQQLLDEHPALTADDRASLLFRIALAAKNQFDLKAAQQALDELSKTYPAAIAQVGGKDVVLHDALAAAIAAPTTQPTQSQDRWTTPFGDPTRSRIVQHAQFGGTRMGYRDIEPAAPRGVQKTQLQELQRQQEASRPLGYSTGVFPVFDRGELFFQDNARIYATDVESGEPLPGWAESYPQSGAYTLPDAWPLPQGLPCMLALTEDSVFATMGLMDYTAAQFVGMVSAHDTRLVCLDRKTGQPRWTFLSQQLPENLANLDFAGCPYVDRTTVYIQAHGSHGSFDDAYLLAFDRGDGAFRWSCYLCSANLGTPDFDPTANPYPVATTIAAQSGRLFVQTNNGAIVCVDPVTAATVWLSEYPRDSVIMDRNDPAAWSTRRTQMVGPRRPWEQNSPIVSGGNIFAMPADTSSLLVFDQESGRLSKRVLLDDFNNARTLLGVTGDHVVFCSGKRIFCIDWKKYPDVKESDPAVGSADNPPPRASNALVWMTYDLKHANMPDDAIRGRGVVTNDSVIVPTAWQLMRFSLGGGSLKQTFPLLPHDQWSDEEGPGNLLFAGEQMIIAGATKSGALRVSWYTDFAAAQKRLEASETASPRQIEPLLRSARALFTAGQSQAAQQKLDAAIALTPSNSADSRSKTRLYDAAIDLARRAASNHSGDPAMATGFFDRAAPYVTGPVQQVDYRVIRAAYEKQRNNAAGVITLYQQILADPSWRNVNVIQGERTLTAGDLAAESIGYVRESSSGSYDPIEAAAQAAFTAAQSSQNIEQLIEVARAYPNSSIVGKAYSTAGEQAQFSGDHRRAAQLFRAALASTSEVPERLQLLARMAQSYSQLPNGIETAAGRLRQAARLAPNAKLTMPITLPDGRSFADLSFAEAARQLQAAAGAHSSDTPDCAIPTNARSTTGERKKRLAPFTINEQTAVGTEIVSLLDGPDGFSRNGRLVAKTASGVVVLKPGGQPLYSLSAPHVLQAAWVAGNLALLDGKSITFAAGESGKQQWQRSLAEFSPEPRLSVAADEPTAVVMDDREANAPVPMAWGNQVALIRARRLGLFNNDEASDAVETFTGLAPLSDRLICSTSRGRVLAFGLGDGKLLWQRQVGDRPIVRLLASDDFVVAQTRDMTNFPLVIDTLDGTLLHGSEAGSAGYDSRVLGIALSPDGMLVMTGLSNLSGKDLFEPGPLSQPTYQFPPKTLAITFYNLNDPQNVQIEGRRVFTLTDGGMKLRVVGLDDGKPVSFNQSQSIDTGAKMNSPLQLVADGGRCYVASENWVHGYDLDRGAAWGNLRTPLIREIALTQSHVIALANQPSPEEGDKPTGQSELQLYSRAADEHDKESGFFEYRFQLPKGFNAVEWQPLDGGIYVLGGDHHLLWLAGNGAAQR